MFSPSKLQFACKIVLYLQKAKEAKKSEPVNELFIKYNYGPSISPKGEDCCAKARFGVVASANVVLARMQLLRD